jgi:SPP1 gp7 family putative phage head morphogenesis protein
MTIENSLIRKQILNQRYINSVARKYLKEISDLLDVVSKKLERQPNNDRLQAIRADLSTVMARRLNQLGIEITDDMVGFGVDEMDFVGDVANANSKVLLRVPDAAVIRRALQISELQILDGAKTLLFQEVLEKFTSAQISLMQRTISDGILLGDSIRDIAAQVKALSTGKTAAQTKAVTRTLVNHTTAQARKSFLAENSEVFDGDEWIAVLDSRTTLICAGRDGRVYPIGSGPYPPAHYQCRSLRVPVLKSQFESATQKSNREDFDTWLKDQDKSFQDEYFSQFPDGKDKSKLFRDGGLEIQRFRDETGKEYSLDELRALNPVAFDKANLKNDPAGFG